jgi:uncharacterized protein (UPF0276 family)
MKAKLIAVRMGEEDWAKVVYALDYLSARPAILERDQEEADEYDLISASIQDVVSP